MEIGERCDLDVDEAGADERGAEGARGERADVVRVALRPVLARRPPLAMLVRHGADHEPARDAAGLDEHGDGIVHVLEDLAEDHDVDRSILVRERLDGRDVGARQAGTRDRDEVFRDDEGRIVKVTVLLRLHPDMTIEEIVSYQDDRYGRSRKARA